MYIRTEIKEADIEAAEAVLKDNGIDDAPEVLQAIGYALLDEELYPNN